MLDSYIAKVEKNVDTFTLEEGLYPVSTQIIIDEDEQSDSFGNIQGMKLVVSMAKAKDSEDTYKNTKDNISIEIEKIRIKENDVIKDDTVAQQISDLKRKLSEMYNISEDVIDIVYE
jgi:triacylglycerol esterase/lipase EstA (alpha/beta hydrolase family)